MSEIPVDEHDRKTRRMEDYAAYLDRTGQRPPDLAALLDEGRPGGGPSTPDGDPHRPKRAVTSTDHRA